MLAFKPFESWAPGSDWTLGLPQGEEVVAVAAGTTFCAAVTSQNCLRLFSISGMPPLPDLACSCVLQVCCHDMRVTLLVLCYEHNLISPPWLPCL